MNLSNITGQCLLNIALFFSVQSAEFNWNKIPFPSEPIDTSTLYSIHAISGNEAIAVGSNGTITYVNVDSKMYSKKNYGDNTFKWICFADSMNGWVVGEGGTVYATIDKGGTWTQQSSTVINNLNAIAAVDNQNAWIAGDSGIILHTSDGGKNWQKQEYELPDSIKINNDDYLDLVSVAFKNDYVGYIGGNLRESEIPVLLMTCDGGLHWTALNIQGARNLKEVAFSNEKPVAFFFNAAQNSVIMQSGNNALSCFEEFQINPIHLENFNKPLFITCSYHKILGRDPNRYYSSEEFAGISNQTFHTIDSIEETIWIAGTNGSIFRSTDWGDNWIAVEDIGKHAIDHFNFVYFKDIRYGFIGGENGTLLSSNDSGRTWQFVFPIINASHSFKDIVFIDSLHGFLVRQNKSLYYQPSSIMSTTDGGKTWTSISNSPTDIDYFRNIDQQNIMCISSRYNSVYYICNGTSTWQPLAISDKIDLLDIYPISMDTIFALGQRINGVEGAIFKSTDRGATLDILSSVDRTDALYKDFYSITFSSPSTAWVVGDSGIILKSIDSGYTWVRQPSPTFESLKKISFCNPSFGWTCGDRELFLTSDGGATWQDKSILSSIKASDVFCPNPENCWTVGKDGIIFHLSNEPDRFIKVVYPDNSTSLSAGDSITVIWKSKGFTQVSIALSYDNGQKYTIYRAVTDNDGKETIRISANAVASNSCKLQISNLDGSVKDESKLFTISNTSSVKLKKIDYQPICRFTGASMFLSLLENTPVTISIYTVTGREVYRQFSVQKKGSTVEKLPIELLHGGCYLVRIIMRGKLFTGKLFVNR